MTLTKLGQSIKFISESVQMIDSVRVKTCCSCNQKKEAKLEYFCKNKNIKDGLSDQCKTCAKIYRDSHKEEKKHYPSLNNEYRREYYSENKNCININRRKYYTKNKEKLNEQAKLRHQKHREKRLVKQKKYYQANKQKIKEINKQYRIKNKESIYLNNRKRKKLLNQYDNIKQIEINNLLIKFNNKCFYCLTDVKSGYNLHLDHKIPLCKGGSHTIQNLAPSCKTCNLRKGRKNSEEFTEQLKKEAMNVL